MLALLRSVGAHVTRHYEEHAGVRLHALSAGQGETIVLLHGAGGGGANWFAVFNLLSRSYRVLAPDLPGFGLSPRMHVGPPLGTSVARSIDAWLDARGEGRVHLVGTSMGGLIALRIAQDNPDRVRTLTLLDAAGLGKSLPLLVRLGTLPGCGRFVRHTSRAGLEFFLQRYLTARPMPEPHRSALLDFLLAVADAGGGETVAQYLSRFASLAGQTEVAGSRALEEIDVPVLVMWGEKDRFLPLRHARRAARALPRARLRIIAGAGHSPNWEMPEAVAAGILDLVRSHPD
jgi:pimeloyl-ACP methyl ester carboxylesterase